MRKVFKKILIVALMIAAILPATSLGTRQSYAATCGTDGKFADEAGFLGLRSWYSGLDCQGNNVKTPECQGSECAELSRFIWQIVGNVLQDLSILAAYLTIGFVIYGGYQYLLARGSTEKALNGKKTIITAFIGLGISMLSYIIFGAIKFAMLKGANPTSTITIGDGITVSVPNTSPDDAFLNTLNWVVGIAGFVALIFIVYGGALYVSSRGEPTKIETAKKTLMYSIIGLFLVAVAEVGIGMVSANIRDARDKAFEDAKLSQVITIKKEQA
ncbi:MAG: pilin [Candidatus Saccharibacteria bacterium]|nr:pilin [Candidatus Saccharibacteria bacterium]